MAAVYVGVHRIGRRDAIKILHREAAKSKEVCIRFEREAAAVNRFRHPGAVEIRDIDVTEDGAPFLVMELLVGESLGERMTRLGKLPVDEVLSHAEQVLDCLAAAHEQDIIHRDIKPANLFLTSEGRVKLLDFGLARMHEVSAIDGLFTKEGTTLGTTPYMPPEQARGKPIDERADIFAVGATMFRLLTGRYIHEANGAFDLLMKMGRDPAPPIRSVAPDLPDSVAMIIDRAIAFDRERRYRNARSMLEDVRAAMLGDSPPTAIKLDFIDHPADRPGAVRDDRNAHTRATPPPAPTLPTSSDEVPIFLSGFSEVSDVASTDRDPPQDEPAAPRQVEHTMISPGNVAKKD
jgi:serine/threonine protein kinase